MNRRGSTFAMWMLPVLVLLAHPLPAQVIDRSAAIRTRPPEPEMTLMAQQFSGEFERWVRNYTETEPTDVRFRWSTTLGNLASVRWQVASSHDDFSTLLASGNAPLPPPGKRAGFNIDFEPIVAGDSRRPLVYWVRLAAYKETRGDQPARAPSHVTPPVRVNFTGPGEPTEFTFLGLRPELLHTLPLSIDLETLKLQGDGGIEPYLLVAVVYADGTTIVPRINFAEQRIEFPDSGVRVVGVPRTHGNVAGSSLDEGETVSLPHDTGHYEATIHPIGLQLATERGFSESQKRDLRSFTQVGILVVGMEEDAVPSTETVDEMRDVLVSELQSAFDGIVRGIVLTESNPTAVPNLVAAVQNVAGEIISRVKNAAKAKTMDEIKAYMAIPGAPLLGLIPGLLNADDYVGTDVYVFSYQQLLDAGETGLPISLDLSGNPDEPVQYIIHGRVRIR